MMGEVSGGRPSARKVETSAGAEEERAERTAAYRSQRLETLGALAGGVVHDLNNVLTPILMSASLLLDSVENPEDRKLLRSILSTAERGEELVRQILWLARSPGGERRPVRLDTLLSQLERLLRHTLPRTVDLKPEFSKDLPPVLGDAVEVFQALLNICLTGRDSMPSGGVLRLKAGAVKVGDGSGSWGPTDLLRTWVAFEVSDTGRGIPQSEIERFFETEVSSPESPPAGETSLGSGLMTARSIVENHGGSLEVVSGPGRGTVFRLLLPALEKEEETEPEAPDVSLPAPAAELTLLVADADPDVLKVTSLILESRGYRVLQAATGLKAVEVFTARRKEISGVVCEVDLPGLDGVEVLGEMARIDPRVRCLLTTARAGVAAPQPAKGVLVKPWKAAELLRAVAELVECPAEEASR